MKNFNKQMFLTDVTAIEWIRALGQTDDIDILVSNWSNLFSLFTEKHAPFKRCEFRISIAPGSILILGHLFRQGIS